MADNDGRKAPFPGYLTGGMGNVAATGGHQQHRERLWASPHCLPLTATSEQGALW